MHIVELRDKLSQLRDSTVQAIKTKIKQSGEGRIQKEFDFVKRSRNGKPLMISTQDGRQGMLQLAGINRDDVFPFFVFVQTDNVHDMPDSEITDPDDFSLESLLIILEQFPN